MKMNTKERKRTRVFGGWDEVWEQWKAMEVKSYGKCIYQKLFL